MAALTVSELMTRLVVTLSTETSIEDATQKLLANRISGAPVVREGDLVGVVSEADLIRAFAPPALAGSGVTIHPLLLLMRGIRRRDERCTVVGDVMNPDVLTVAPSAEIWEAAGLIENHGVRRLPVVDASGHLVGVLTRSDLVRALAQRLDGAGPVLKADSA
jgi:CBS domain-containing protein